MTREIPTRAEGPPATLGKPAPDGSGAVDLSGLQAMWLDWTKSLLKANQLPFSGNVDQWIRTFGQVGLLNVNIAGSGNPELEKEIASRYSYGRQLGRILAVLAPLVEDRKELIDGHARDEFDDMVRGIARLKRASVDDVVAQVKAWEDSSPRFREDLDELLRQLTTLQAATR